MCHNEVFTLLEDYDIIKSSSFCQPRWLKSLSDSLDELKSLIYIKIYVFVEKREKTEKQSRGAAKHVVHSEGFIPSSHINKLAYLRKLHFLALLSLYPYG